MDERVPAELPLSAGALNGGRPGWDARSQRLFWADIREPALHMLDPATRKAVLRGTPARIGCCAPGEGGDAMVALATRSYHIGRGADAFRHIGDPRRVAGRGRPPSRRG